MRIGIDLGGSKIAGAVVHNGKILRELIVPTGRRKGRAHISRQLKHVVDTLRDGKKIPVGVGAPDFPVGTKLTQMTNIPEVEGLDLRKVLGSVKVANDADCFVLGEWKYGVAKGTKRVVGLTLGTGLGSGVIYDGKLLTGRTRKVPELGHLLYDENAKVFRHGGNEWESLLSGRAIVKRHRKNGGKEKIATDIWDTDSHVCRKTRAEVERLLAVFCANIVRMYDPEVIVIGGGAARPAMIRGANKLMKHYKCKPILKASKLREKAAILGATCL